MKPSSKRALALVIGVDVGGFRRSHPYGPELVVIEATDLRHAQAISQAIDRAYPKKECIKLLSVDARTSAPNDGEHICTTTAVRTLASFLDDIVTVGIAAGAVVSVDAGTDMLALWDAVSVDLKAHGYNVVDHVPGWTPDDWEPHTRAAHREEPVLEIDIRPRDNLTKPVQYT